MKDNINCPFDKISGYPEYADTKEHSGYVYVEKYTLHGDTYYVAKGRSNLSLKREGDNAKIGSSGDDCVIMCAGINSSAKAKIGSWITLAEWKYSEEKQRDIPFSVVTKQVDGIEIKEDVYYTLQDGKFKESKQH